jgi:hypothetical protein
MVEPVRMIFENDRRAVAATPGGIKRAHTPGLVGERHMNFDVSHFRACSACGA